MYHNITSKFEAFSQIINGHWSITSRTSIAESRIFSSLDSSMVGAAWNKGYKHSSSPCLQKRNFRFLGCRHVRKNAVFLKLFWKSCNNSIRKSINLRIFKCGILGRSWGQKRMRRCGSLESRIHPSPGADVMIEWERHEYDRCIIGSELFFFESLCWEYRSIHISIARFCIITLNSYR